MFKAYEAISYDNYTCPSTLTDTQLIQGHKELMECPVNSSYWGELDGELCHRHEEDGLKWPY